MSYGAARDALARGRSAQKDALMGRSGGAWFTDQWGDVAAMLDVFGTDAENRKVAKGYTIDPHLVRAAAHLRLDYVCALRREVRKQYVSGDDGICTDVTPFRHGVLSAHGAALFDDLMDKVVQSVEQRSQKGGKA